MKGQLDAANGLIGRYRVVLGIDRASEGALAQLTNQELALRAQGIVAKLRELSRELQNRTDASQKSADSRKGKKAGDGGQQRQILAELTKFFDENVAGDMLNIDNELRKRLSGEALSHVIRAPAFVAGESRVTFLALVRSSPMGAMLIPAVADEIEQMYKLLPSDK